MQGWYKIIVFSVGISWCRLHHDIPTENTIILYHSYEGKNSNIRTMQGWYKSIVFSVRISWCRLYHDIPTENTIILYHSYEGKNSNIEILTINAGIYDQILLVFLWFFKCREMKNFPVINGHNGY